MTRCECVIKDREEDESMREWFKRWMCMHHWMQTDYYQNKLSRENRDFKRVSNSERDK